MLEGLARGLSTEQTARELHLSPHTVRTYIRSAMAKLDAHTRTHAVALALTRGEIAAPGASPARRGADAD